MQEEIQLVAYTAEAARAMRRLPQLCGGDVATFASKCCGTFIRELTLRASFD